MGARSPRWWTAVALATAAVGTGGGCSGTPETGVNTAFDRACELVNKGARLAVDGYLAFPDQVNTDQAPVMRLRAGPGGQGPSIGVSVSWGTKPNRIKSIPRFKSFSDDDLVIYLADGSQAGAGDRIKVSGTMYLPPVPQEFPCALENPKFERA